MHFIQSLSASALLLSASLVQAAGELKPFVLVDQASSDLAAVSASVQSKLEKAGFEVVGDYSPYEGVKILAVTNDALKQEVAKSDFGAFGAAQRVTITAAGGKVQVAYTNPTYMANAYRMKSDLDGVSSALASALGSGQTFGSEDGLTAEQLRKYHYKFLMPYFDDQIELASYGSQDAAIKAVEAGLAAGKGGASKVYRIDVSNGESVIGVGMTVECSSDKYIMSKIDFKDIKSTGHLPYEVVVKNGKVYTLPAQFRIAINFPDLSMIGSNSFASIMCAPDEIKTALTKATGGKPED